MPSPLVTGVSPREGCAGVRIIIRGENLGVDGKDLIGLTICGENCLDTASWQSPNKIFAYSGYGQGKGDVIVTTKGGGIGKCSVSFLGREEQAGQFQEVAVWVEEDAVTLFGLNTLKTSALLPDNADESNESATDNSTANPAEELYDMFPGSSADITQSNFNPYYYLLVHKSNATTDELRLNFEHLRELQSENEGGSTAVNKNNIAPFLEAVDIMKHVRGLSVEDRKRNLYEPVIKLIEEIAHIAFSMYGTDLARKDYSDTIRSALNVIQRYKFIFHLPQTIERSIQREEYEKAITDLVRARAVFETVDSKAFRTIQREVGQQIKNLRTLFQQHLNEFPSSLDDQKTFIHYLHLLDPRADPAWDCITHQTTALIDILRSCTIASKRQNNIKSHQPTAMVDQACDILTTAFPDLWQLVQLYLKRKLYPLSEDPDRVYTHLTPEFIILAKEIIQTFIQIIRLNLLNQSSTYSEDDVSQRVQSLPHCVQNCRLCVLKIVLLDLPVDLKKDLHQLIFDLRLECFKTLMDHAHLEISRLDTRETWELDTDEQLGSHTKLPNLFHDLIVTKINIIDENILTVNTAKGERKFFEEKETKEQIAVAIYHLFDSFGSVLQKLKGEHRSKTRYLIILLNNLIYTRRFIIPRLKKTFSIFNFRGMDRVYEQVETNYQTVDEELLDAAHNEYCQSFQSRIKLRMYAGNFDWATHTSVTSVKDYIKHIIFDLARIHAEVYSISTQLAFRISSRISSTVVDELAELYSKINQFSKAGHMQACLDFIALRECLEYYMEKETSDKLKELISKIPDMNEHIRSKEFNDILNAFIKQIKPY